MTDEHFAAAANGGAPKSAPPQVASTCNSMHKKRKTPDISGVCRGLHQIAAPKVGASGLESPPDFTDQTGSESNALPNALPIDPAHLAEAIGRLNPAQRAAILAALGVVIG